MTIPKFLLAQGRMEGILVKGSLAQVNNNPGNIEWGPFAESFGAVENGRFAKFKTIEDGYAAMTALMTSARYNFGQMTVLDALHTWLGDRKGPDGQWIVNPENDPKAYIAGICAMAGCEADDIVAQLLGVSGDPPVQAV